MDLSSIRWGNALATKALHQLPNFGEFRQSLSYGLQNVFRPGGWLNHAGFPGLTGADVLDVGCGDGRWHPLMKQAQPRSLIGLDLSERKIEEGIALGNFQGEEVLHGELGAIAARIKGRFDIATAFNLCLPDPPNYKEFSQSLSAVLRPGGLILLMIGEQEVFADALPHFQGNFRCSGLHLWGDCNPFPYAFVIVGRRLT
jgi:SAM-dependent methyltransferase